MDYLGYTAKQTPIVFLDFENSLVVLNTLTQKLGEAENVRFWHVGHKLRLLTIQLILS